MMSALHFVVLDRYTRFWLGFACSVAVVRRYLADDLAQHFQTALRDPVQRVSSPHACSRVSLDPPGHLHVVREGLQVWAVLAHTTLLGGRAQIHAQPHVASCHLPIVGYP